MIPKHLEIMCSHIGDAEIAGEVSHPWIARALESVKCPPQDDVYAWCAAAVNECLEEAGFRGTGKANAKSYLEWGVKCGAEIGAVAVMDRGPDPAKGHVAFVLDVDPEHDMVYLVAGNTRNRVSVSVKYIDAVKEYRRLA